MKPLSSRGAEASPRPEPVLTATGLTVAYGGAELFTDVAVELAPGEHAALTGRSGSGKTTLLLVLAGLLAPSAGRVSWPGLSPQPVRRRQEIGMVFQAPSLLPDLTVVENVMLPLRLQAVGRDEARRRALAALARVEAEEVALALPQECSGGQLQRAGLARVLAGEYRLIFADEPTGSLDRELALVVLAQLRQYCQESGATLVIATHDEELARAMPTQLRLVDSAVAREVLPTPVGAP